MCLLELFSGTGSSGKEFDGEVVHADKDGSPGRHTIAFVCNHYQTLINDLIESRIRNDQKIQDQIDQLRQILPRGVHGEE